MAAPPTAPTQMPASARSVPDELRTGGNIAALPRDPEDKLPAPGATPVNLAAPPSLDDAELVGRLRTLFNQARQYRSPVIQQWRKNHRMMRNRTWSAQPAWMPTPEVPEIFPIISSCVAWVTDQRPEFEMAPAAQPFNEFYSFYNALAVDMKTAANAAWQTYQWEAEIEQVVWDGYQYDTGYIKACWDATLAGGLGDVSLKRIDPWTFYPDPQATSMSDANYFIEAREMSLQELDRRFPGAASRFELQGWIDQTDKAPQTYQGSTTTPRANTGALSPATSARYGLPGQSRLSARVDDTTGVTLLECWVREHYRMGPATDADGNADSAAGEKVYETWRCICIAGPHVLMNKRAEEIFPFNRHPYVRYKPDNLGEFYGQSMVELLSPSQIAINRLLQALQLGIELTGNPPFIESTNSGMQRTKITNKPGQRITKNAGTEADWLKPPTLQPLMSQLIEFYIREMERVSGLSAMARAQTTGGRNSTDVLDNIQEAGFVRIRLALRNLERCIREVGELVIAMIAEFYTEPRLVSIVGPNGSRTARAFSARHFYVPTKDGAVPMRFQLLVQAGSSLPTSRNARMAEADTLFSLGAIDRRALLQAHNWPNAENILQRVEAAEAAGTFAPPGARQRAQRQT